MAFNQDLQSFTWNTSDAIGATHVLTFGFQAKMLFVWTSGRPESVDTIGRRSCFIGKGFATSASDRRAMIMRSNDNQTFGTAAIRQQTDAVLIECAISAGDAAGALDIDSISSTAVTFIVDAQATLNNYRVHVLALGGSDFANVATFGFQEPAATGSQSITSLG